MRRLASLVPAVLVMLYVIPACGAQQTPEQAGAARLFSQDQGGLPERERVALYQGLGLKLDSTGKGFLDTSCDQPADAVVTFSDWNGDGNKEVLVIFGNSCTSGMAGSSAVLFIKDSAGQYQPNLGFPASSAEPQSTSNLGYPDLLIGGPGFCFPLWRWNGTAYDFLKSEPQMSGGCDNR
jgi:hypothetical protein